MTGATVDGAAPTSTTRTDSVVGTATTTTLATAMRVLGIAAAGAFLLVYVVVAVIRLRHPFELEWMEGAMVDHVARVVAGQPLYAAPSLDFVPFLYPPGFYWVAALVAQMTGVGFVALRLVSLAASLVTFALLYQLVRRETGDRSAALLASGLFAATYAIGGTFFDLGRVDSLCLALVLGTVYLLRFHSTSAAHAAVAGVLAAAAFLTKQSAAVMLAPVVLYTVWRQPRRGLVTMVVGAMIASGATLLLDGAHDGWYRYYAFEIPSQFTTPMPRLVRFWLVDILPPLAIAWSVGMVYFVTARAGSPRLFHAAVATGLIGGAWMSRGNPGGYLNVLIPAFLVASVLFGLGLHAARAALAGAGALRGGEPWLGAVCVLQFLVLVYDPREYLPTQADRDAGHAVVRTIAAAEGDVWIPYHGHLATMAGKRQYAHWMAMSDVLTQSPRAAVRQALQNEIDGALRSGRFGLVIQSNHPFGDSPDFATFYDVDGTGLIADPDVFMPVTGSPRRVQTLYVRKAPAQTEARAPGSGSGSNPSPALQ